MIKIMTSYFILTTIMMMLMSILPLLNKHLNKNREKLSPFECGFDPLSQSRMSFSIQFFSITLMFLMFDVEITIMMPLPMINFLPTNLWMITIMFFTLILIMGIFIEWKQGTMNWK